MNSTQWTLVESTRVTIDGRLTILELSAQSLNGWDSQGSAFHRVLSQNIDLPFEVIQATGVDQDYLDSDGIPPSEAIAEFCQIAGPHPLAVFNKQVQFNQGLYPALGEHHFTIDKDQVFCLSELAKRVLDPMPVSQCKLDTLAQFYALPTHDQRTSRGRLATGLDLVQQVFKPLCDNKGLTRLDEIIDYSRAPFFPSRIAFGQYKGRHVQDALKERAFYQWLEQLAGSDNARSATMGAWYLAKLDALASEDSGPLVQAPPEAHNATTAALMVYACPEIETLKQLIAQARERLSDLQAEYTQDRLAVEHVQAALFSLLRPLYEQRDQLRITIQYRTAYIDTLIQAGEDEAQDTLNDYHKAQSDKQHEYEEAAADAEEKVELSEALKAEIKSTYRQLVKLYHPDRYADDPERQEAYTALTSHINEARDRGDLDTLKEIAADPNRFLQQHGCQTLEMSEELDLDKLRSLHEALQAEILSVIEQVSDLRASAGYELYQMSVQNAQVINTLAEEQAEDISAEIADLEQQAEQLAVEISNLTGSDLADVA